MKVAQASSLPSKCAGKMPALLTATVGNRGARHLRPRLRGLNCPELVTAEGKAAKRCVEGLLPPGTTVTITTTKPDKYDRYLADVFVDRESGEIFAERKLDFQGDRVREGFPEEFNRCAITAMSDVHLCPTETSKNNVLASNPKDINYW